MVIVHYTCFIKVSLFKKVELNIGFKSTNFQQFLFCWIVDLGSFVLSSVLPRPFQPSGPLCLRYQKLIKKQHVSIKTLLFVLWKRKYYVINARSQFHIIFFLFINNASVLLATQSISFQRQYTSVIIMVMVLYRIYTVVTLSNISIRLISNC